MKYYVIYEDDEYPVGIFFNIDELCKFFNVPRNYMYNTLWKIKNNVVKELRRSGRKFTLYTFYE